MHKFKCIILAALLLASLALLNSAYAADLRFHVKANFAITKNMTDDELESIKLYINSFF